MDTSTAVKSDAALVRLNGDDGGIGADVDSGIDIDCHGAGLMVTSRSFSGNRVRLTEVDDRRERDGLVGAADFSAGIAIDSAGRGSDEVVVD